MSHSLTNFGFFDQGNTPHHLLRVLEMLQHLKMWTFNFFFPILVFPFPFSQLESILVRQSITPPAWKWWGKMKKGNNLCQVSSNENFPMNKSTNKEKSNKCSHCGFAAYHADHLKTHMKSHSREIGNKCKLCDYASSYSSNLRVHLKAHGGEKSYKCNQCDYASLYGQ